MSNIPYKTSRDYAALWELSKTQIIPCFIRTFFCAGESMRLAEIQRGEKSAYICSRSGQTSEVTHTVKAFTEACKALDLEYIVPHEEVGVLQVRCEACDGTGFEHTGQGFTRSCKTCNGEGYTEKKGWVE